MFGLAHTHQAVTLSSMAKSMQSGSTLQPSSVPMVSPSAPPPRILSQAHKEFLDEVPKRETLYINIKKKECLYLSPNACSNSRVCSMVLNDHLRPSNTISDDVLSSCNSLYVAPMECMALGNSTSTPCLNQNKKCLPPREKYLEGAPQQPHALSQAG